MRNPEKEIPVSAKIDTPTALIDSIVCEARPDGIFVLSLLQQTHGNFSELYRVALTKEHVIRTVDMLCRTTKYYPSDSGK